MKSENLHAESGLFQTSGAPVPLVGVEVRGNIAGRATKVCIGQRFRNAEEQPIEAVYKFPLPESAALCGFRAFVDGRLIEGELEEREKAFEIYDKALSNGDGAQLLDEERPNIFTLSVGNMKPGSSVIIEIDYVMLLDTDGSEVRFCLPTTISPRYTPDDQQDHDGIPVVDIVNPPFAPSVPYGLKLNMVVHNISDISSIGSPSHPVQTELSTDNATVSLASESAAMDRDFILTISYKQAFSTKGMVFEGVDANYYQIDFVPQEPHAENHESARTEKREIVFVLDCSGSMAGSSIAEARKALEIMIKALDPGVLFNIYRFGSQYEHLFVQSKVYDETTMKEALRYLVDSEASLGGTEILAPLKEIYGNPLPGNQLRDIILITDGEVSNEASVMDLARRHADRTVIHTVGIGNGPNEFLVKGLARVSGGATALVAPNERIEPKILRLFQKVMDGSVRNLRLAWDGDADQAPCRGVTFLRQGTSIFARGNAGSSLRTTVRLTGDTRSGAGSWDVPLVPVHGEVPIPALWAREKIRDIEEGHDGTGGSRQLERQLRKKRQEIIAISKQYGIISRETSYVGIEKRSPNDQVTDDIALRKVPVMLTDGWGGLSGARMVAGAPVVDWEMRPNSNAELYDARITTTVYCYDMDTDLVGKSSQTRARDESDNRLVPFFSRTTRTVQPAVEERDLLLELLSGQQAYGGFVVSGSLLNNTWFADLYDRAESMVVNARGDKARLMMTMAVLLVLELHFPARRDEWEGVVRKSRTWLAEELERTQPTIDGQPLEEWLRGYLVNQAVIDMAVLK